MIPGHHPAAVVQLLLDGIPLIPHVKSLTPKQVDFALTIVLVICQAQYLEMFTYSGTPLNRHPSTVDIYDIPDNSESPDYPSIHFNS